MVKFLLRGFAFLDEPMCQAMWTRVCFMALVTFLAWQTPAGAQLVGEEAPPFQAADLEGKSINLGAVLGKQPVLLVFWASW